MFSCVPFESVLLYAANVDYELAEHYLRNLANIRLSITGDDLKSLGVLPGKKYKEIFDFLLEERIKGQALTKEDELALVKERYL